jgi:predicted heme/steroid binding protein/uncharacterized membrane protein
MVKKFSKEELTKFDGKSGAPIYVAYKNKVYDLTQSPLWKFGIHANTHKAGIDSTESILNAPHGEEIFERYSVVGELGEESGFDLERKLLRVIKTGGMDRRIHRMTAHFPISLLMTASLLILLYEYIGNRSFEVAAYYTLSLGVIASPISVLSGLWGWKISYLGVMTKIFKRKILISVPLLVIGFLCLILRSLYPDILVEKLLFSWIYLIMVLCLTPIVITLGYYGGKITFLRPF